MAARRPRLAADELGECSDREAVGLLGAHGHAQRIRQLVALHLAQDQAALDEERVGIGGSAAFRLREMDQHEVGDARRHLEAELADLGGQPDEPLVIVGARPLDMRGIGDRGDAGGARRGVDVERTANAVDRIDEVLGPVKPAEPQRSEAVDLRERTQHDDVLGGGDELDAGFIVVAAHVFRIGGIDHQQHMGRQPAVQALDLVERHIGAGRVVRIGEEHDLGARGDGGEDRIDVGGVVLFRRGDRFRAGAQGRDRIDQEAVRGVDRLVAVAEIGVRNEIDEVVGPGAADDALGVQSEGVPDRLA